MAVALLQPVHAREAEPDWTNRFLALKAEIASSFVPPQVGDRITIIRRIGGPYTGRVDALSSDSVIVDGKKYEARQLTDETCAQLFSDFFAAQKARTQVLIERNAYRQRAIAEQQRRGNEEQAKGRIDKTPPLIEARSETNSVPADVNPPGSPAQPPAVSKNDGVRKYVLLLVGIYCLHMILRALRKRVRIGVQIRRAKRFLATVKKRKGLSPISTGLTLGKAEDAFMEDVCTLNETRSERQYESRGIGFRIAKGVYVGGTRGRSISTPRMTRIDSGRLTLTNKRLVFDGRTEDRIIPLTKIVSVNALMDAIEVSTEGRQRSMYFTVRDPLIWAALIRILTAAEDPANVREEDLNITFGFRK